MFLLVYKHRNTSKLIYQSNFNMSKVIKLKRGLDIRLVGEAEKTVMQMPVASSYALIPDSFPGITPKLLVAQGDKVKAGAPLFFDKARPQIMFTSPVSGTVAEIRRGEKRRILSVVINADAVVEYETFQVSAPAKSTREKITEVLLQSGLWPFIIQRPYGIVANPTDTPKAIFVSGFDTAPLAPDMNFVLKDEYDNLATGFEVLRKLTDGKVHLGLRNGDNGVLNRLTNVEQHLFEGPHPAGNVGIQIHHIDPINKDDVVWTVDIQNVAVIGRLFNTGKVDMHKTIAVTGSEVVAPKYVSMIAGASIEQVVIAAEEASLVEGIARPDFEGPRAGGNHDVDLTLVARGDLVEARRPVRQDARPDVHAPRSALIIGVGVDL